MGFFLPIKLTLSGRGLAVNGPEYLFRLLSNRKTIQLSLPRCKGTPKWACHMLQRRNTEESISFLPDVCHLPSLPADTARGVCVDPERRPSPAKALGSVGRCAIESAPRAEDAEIASFLQRPEPVSAAGLMSCPTHESPGHEHTH